MDEVQVDLDTVALATAKQALRRFSPELRAAAVPRLMAVGETIAGDVRRAILAYPVQAGTRRRTAPHVRTQMAAGIDVRPYGTAPDVGVLIRSTGGQLPAQQQALVRAWNLSRFRHPVYGRNTRRWAEQVGIRYFTTGAVQRRQAQLTRAFEDAVADAIRATGEEPA